jgi:hypothetical protein
VSDANGQDSERADAEAAAGQDLDQLGVIEQAVLFELALDEGEGELSSVDRDVELGKDPGQAADVVLVAVGEHDGANLVAILGEVGDVGYNDIDTEELLFRKHQAGIDHDDVIVPTQGEAVHPELA